MRFSMITLGGLLLAAATPAMAQDAPPAAEEPTPAFTITGGATVTSDYRFRGLSQTGKDPALQATINVNHSSGLYAGIWASTIDDNDAAAVLGYGDAEVDLYAGYTKTFDNGLGVDVGLLYYLYPIDKAGFDTDFFEPYASLMYTVGPVTTKVGANYSWSGQSGLVGNDSLYLRADVTVAVPKTPISILGHIGRTNGQLGVLALTSDKYTDWSLGVEASYKFAKIGVQYVDTNIKDFSLGYDDLIGADPTVLAYLTFSF
jgi:uncharacterized protein (TIGR02001 family)